MRLAWIVVALVTLGCGAKLPPDTSPEAKIAVRATQVVAALRATLPAIKSLTCTAPALTPPVCLSPADAIRVVTRIEQAGEHAERLATALQIVDAATDAASRATGMQRVTAILGSIQGSLAAAQIAPAAEPGRAAVVAILSSVMAILLTIGGVA